ncbi:hypothetical protein Pcinc_015635 [Petrolisthes cinctipes]|uniref:Amino acid transporter transmembrane domain-containing protein n=1 Tax=Petrolisthes cinctipes TaxID=88211 RepID=A0AAE1FXX2_PETCI|nr:hypothetical protein Pcinc_015635 [Petrolisthes cinctipes]
MYGDTVKSNILLTVELTPIVTVAIALEIINLLCTFMISLNPVVQSVEEAFNVPAKFGWKRVVTRSVIVMCQILIGITVPSFGKILNLIGGSLITICTFILPPLMYMKLADDRSDPKWPIRKIEPWERILLVEIMIVGVLGGLCSTLTSAYDVVVTSFSSSCFTEFNTCSDPT